MYDLYDVLQKRDEVILEIKRKIEIWEATEEECIMVMIEFQKEINRILKWNSLHDNI